MKIKILGALALLCFVSVAGAHSPQWREGENYFPVEPAQPVSVPAGKVEVTEVFSYACPACNLFYPIMDRLRKTLPANAVVDYVAAGFLPSEDWPVFQRAYYTAKALGVEAKTHYAMFDAVWKTGQLQTVDPETERLTSPLPSIKKRCSVGPTADGYPHSDVNPSSAGGYEEMAEVVKWLVAKQTKR